MRVPEPARRPSVSPSLFARNSSISRMLFPAWRDATRKFGATCVWMRRWRGGSPRSSLPGRYPPGCRCWSSSTCAPTGRHAACPGPGGRTASAPIGCAARCWRMFGTWPCVLASSWWNGTLPGPVKPARTAAQAGGASGSPPGSQGSSPSSANTAATATRRPGTAAQSKSSPRRKRPARSKAPSAPGRRTSTAGSSGSTSQYSRHPYRA